MVKQTPPTPPNPPTLPTPHTPEEQAALLKAKEKPLGKAGDAAHAEDSPIAWETGLPAQPGEAETGTMGSGVAGSSGRAGSMEKVGAGGTADTVQHSRLEGAEPFTAPSGGSHAATRGAGSGDAASPTPLAQGTDETAAAGSATSAGNSSRLASADFSTAAGSGAGSAAAGAGAAHVTDASSSAASQTGGTSASGGTAMPALHISGDLTRTVVEDGALAASGKLGTTGGMPGTHQWSLASAPAKFGTLTLDPDGTWHYQLDNALPAVQALGAKAQISERFLVLVTDAQGTLQKAEIVVSIHGTNDAAVITGVATQPVTEDTQPSASGKLDITDVDTGEAHFQAGDIVGQHGTLHLAADGQWTYDLDNAAAQKLGAGDTATDTLTVRAADGTMQQISITLHGTNDAATISGTSTVTVTEDATVMTATGQLTVTDPDAGEVHFAEQISTPGSYGSFSIAAEGTWTYLLDNNNPNVQQLGAGDTVTDVITVSTADGTKQQLSITINGTNDAPVLQAQSQSVTEDGAILTGKMVATDVDQGDTQVFTTQNPPPGFTLSPDGSYSFDASNPAYQHLAASQSLVIDIPVTVTDRDGATDTQTLQITVTGTNDAPRVFGPVNLGQMQEDGRLVLTSPQLLAQAGDIDTGDTLTLSQLAADHGQIVDNGDGTYTFTPDANYNGPVTVSYQITDSQGASVSGSAGLNVSPVGDIAVIDGVDTGTVTEDVSVDQARRLGAGGQLTVTDPDAGEDHFTAQTNTAGNNGFGSFRLDASGHWTYSADNRQVAVQQLKTGEQLTDSLTVTSADGTSHTVTVTIKGTNDAPVLQAQSQSVAEDGALLNGKMHATDADAGETQTFSTRNPPAGFTLSADGSYSFDPSDVAYQHLGLGQPQVLSIPVTVTDSTGLTSTRNLVITITGTNDAPQLSATPVKVLEGAAPIQGQLTATDPDTGDTLTYSVKGRVPGVVLNPDGSFHFDPTHAAYNSLSEGQERVVSIPITVTDGHGGSTTQSLEITVTGTNDGPALIATAQTVSEGAAVLNGQLVGTDPDSGDTLTYSTTATPEGFTLSADGSYSFDPAHAAYNEIGFGQTRVLTIPVTVSDGHSGTATQNLQITVTGTNDVPVMVAEPARTTAEDSAVLRGQLAANDPDHTDTLTYRATAPVSGFLINPDGSYTFNPGDSAYNHLAAGQSQVVSIPVVVTDGHGGTDTQVLQITVTGTDDGPAFVIAGTRSATEGGAVLTGQLTATDPDTGDTLTYGTNAQVAGFALNADGSYSFDPSHADYDSLGVGHNKTVSVPITVTDSQGQSVTQTLRITIVGTDDNPTVSAVAPATVAEDSAVLKGRLTIADVDAGDVLTCRTSATVAGFNLNPDGSYTFDTSNHAYDHLAPGDSEVLSIPVTVSDGHGGSASRTLQITITGANDGPALTVVDQTVSEGAAVLHGQLAATDPDRGDTLTYSTGATMPGFTLNDDGSYSFDADHTAYNSLGVGHSQVVSIPITVTDSHGGTDTRNLQITVEGTDDAPILTATPRSVSEGDAPIQGRLTAADQDVGDALAYSTTATVAGFRLTPDGSYSFNPADAAYNSLAAGTTQDVTIPVTVSDGHGGTTTQNLIITVAGTNDAARISGTSTGIVTEDAATTAGKITATGTLTVTDVDTGEAHFATQTTIAGTYGSLSIDEQGHWGYTADNSQIAIQQLKAGDSLTESLKVTSADGTSHTVTVTIQGTNDAPVLQAQTQAVAEDGAMLQGHLSASDVDTGDTQAFSTSAQVAGFTLNPDGSYSFDPSDAAYQHLAAGQTETLTIPVTVTDSAGATSTQNLTITITGTDDKPIIRGVNSGATSEDITQSVSGQLTLSDIDDGQAHFTAQSGTVGSYGNLTLSEDGHWNYQLDNSKPEVQALKTGQTVTDSFTVLSADGTPHHVTVAIRGRDDGAVIGGSDTGSVKEDRDVHGGLLETGGQLAVTDPDAAQSGFVAQSDVAGRYGHFSMDATGAWNYRADNSSSRIQALREGTLVEDHFVVYSLDGTTHTVRVTLQGSNDAPSLSASSHAVAEDGALVFGQMHATDRDLGDALIFDAPTTVAGFTLHSDGTYRFDPKDPAYQGLADGQQLQLRIPVTVTDSNGETARHSVIILLTGRNDAATISGVATGSVTEDSARQASGSLSVSDIDFGEAHFRAGDISGQFGVLRLDASGQWTYDLDNVSVQKVGAGETALDTLTVLSADGTAHQIAITIHGTNDLALITGVGTATVTEDDEVNKGNLEAMGRLHIQDADQGQAHFAEAGDIVGQYGHFSIDLHGHWTYRADNSQNAIQSLKAGERLTDSVTVHSVDGTEHVVTVTVLGTNDAPSIGGINTGSVSEDVTLIAAGQLSIADADAGQSSFQAQPQAAGQHGVFSLAADGNWRYALNNSDTDVQALTKGQSLTDSLIVKSADGSTHTITVTIQGRDDGAVIAGVDTGRVTEDVSLSAGRLQTGGQLTLTDADASQHSFTAQNQVAGHYGSFSIDASGHWTYSADNSQEAIQHLGRNDSLQDRFQVTSADGTRHTVIVTLQGSNDAPVLASQSRSVTEDGAILTGQMRASDADANDRLVYSTSQQIAGFNLNADGSYSFDPRTSAYQLLGAGAAETLRIPITVRDQSGAQHTQELLITVTGTNDGAVIRGNDTGDVVEDLNVKRGLLTTQGHLGILDPDAAQSSFVEQTDVAGRYGHFSIDAAGAWTYDADNNGNRLQELREGAQAVEHFVVHSLDGTTHSIRVTVHGTNDAPVVTSSAQTVAEDGALLFGQLRVTDTDRGDQQHFQLDHPVAGFTLDNDGTYRFDPKDPAHQDLHEGQVMRLDVPVTVTDSAGAVVHHTITISMTGRNDAAVITGEDSATVVEDSQGQSGLLQAGGQLHITDIDDGEDRFVIQSGVAGSNGLGHFSVNAAGLWLYTADNAQAAVQELKAGESLTDSFTVQSADGTAHTVTVTIQGTNDSARISGTRTGTVTEDNAVTAGAITATGTLTVTDVDDGEARFVAQSGIAGTYGSLTIDEQGHWTYSAANTQKAIQNLNTGDHLTDTLTVRAADGTTQTITITLEGKDDQVLAGSLTGSAVEDTTPIITGDLRHAQSGTVLHLSDQILHGQFGTLDLRDGGHWVYTLDNANPLVQGLKAGETRTDTITVHPLQGEPQDITITITGTHDQPVIRVPMAATQGIEAVEVVSAINGATHFGSIAETATGVATGLKVVAMYLPGSNVNQLAGIPEDQLASTQSAYTMNGGLGYQYLSSSGWLATHMPSLAATFNTHGARNNWDGGIVVFQDGSIGRMINVHGGDTGEKDYIYFNLIPGVNANHGLTILHGNGTVGATLEVFDGQVSLGHVTVAADGRWTLTATQALVDGDHQLHTLTNGVASDPQTVLVSGGTVTITDQAASLGAVVEDSATQSDISGHLTVSDADINDHPVFTAQHDVQGSYGKFSIDAQGQWHYTLDNNLPATQALAAGQVTTETFHVTVTTDSGETVTRDVTFRVIGTNDAPVLSAQVPQAVDVGGTPIRGQIVATDVDQGDSFSFSTTHTVDGFTIHADGSYTFDPSNAAYQHLAGGQKQDVVIPITVTDSAGSTSTQNVTITVTGVSHVAVITGLDTGTVTENAAQDVVGGQLHVTDPDAGQEHFVSQMQTHGQHGRFTIDPSGAWSYVLDNADPAVQALKAGTTLTDSLTVASVDGTTHVLMVTVKGSNDAPTLQAQSQSVSEDGSRLNGQMVAHDPDAGDSLSFSTGSQISGFTLHSDGSYTFDPGHADYQGLTSGQVKDVVIPITVTDGSGATSQQNLTIHVTGHDDRASITGVDTGRVELGPTPEATGQLNVSDSDAGQSGFQTGQIKGSFGSLTMDAQGHWTYQIDANDWVVKGLLPGSHLTDHVTVHSVDGTEHDIDIEIHGTPAGYQPPVAHVPASTSGGHEIFDAVLAAVRAGGYQYQGLADELDRGSLAAVGNMDLSITGVHVQVVDRFGHTVQSIAPGAENAATLHVSDLLLWHAEGHSIIATSDSGLGSTRMWLHDQWDMHNITVHLPDGTGFNGWTGEYTFGELPLQGPSAAPPPAPAPEQQDFMPDDSLIVHAEPVQIHGLDALHDYLQFADTSPKVGAGGTAHEASSAPLDDYLAAAGVDPAHVSAARADLPPTETLVDAHTAIDSPVTPEDRAADDAALGAVPLDLLDHLPQDDPQHHGA